VRKVLVLLLLASVAAADGWWPTLGDDPESSRLVGGIKNAVIVLIATPYLLVAGASIYLYRRRKP